MESNRNRTLSYGLGIDTGGTYTDAAILDMESGEVLSKAKSLTTRNDLALGIGGAIDRLDHSYFKHIKLIAVSSTLATNPWLKGRMPGGAYCIGHEAMDNIPWTRSLKYRADIIFGRA